MSSSRSFILGLLAMLACLLTACQSGADMKYYNFPDAVTNINQVDPAYRKYFADQQGRNYSADDQRKALAAAIRTSRTPVPAYVPRSAVARSSKSVQRRSSMARRSSARSNRKVASSRKTTSSRKRAVAKKKTTTRKRAVAKKKTTSRRRRG